MFYIKFTPQSDTIQPQEFFEAAHSLIDNTLTVLNNEGIAWKVHPVINIKFIKIGPDGDVIESDEALFSIPSVKSDSFVLTEVVYNLMLKIDEFVCKGSGWIIEGVKWFDLRLTRYLTIQHVAGRGNNYCKLPPKLQAKKAVVNINNFGNDCFRYALLSVLHYQDIPIDRHRSSKYESWLTEHDWSGIFPHKCGTNE